MRKIYTYGRVNDRIHDEVTSGIKNAGFTDDHELVCYFNPELMNRLPYGNDIDPILCPAVVARVFQAGSFDRKFHFGFYKTESS